VAVIVATVLVAVTTIVLVTVGTISHLAERRRELSRLHRDLSAEADQLMDSLALPVWNIDRAQIDKILDSVAGMRNVAAVVAQAAGRTHARVRDEQWRFVAANGPPRRADLLSEQRPILFAGEPIGTVRVYASRRFVDERLRASLLSSIGTIVLVDLLLSLSVYAILWRSVLRPLGAVEQYAQTVSADGAENVSMPLDGDAANELVSLRTSIQSMVQLLAQRYSALQQESAARMEMEDARRRAEAEELRLSNELAQSAMEWRQTFDTVVTPIVITDPDGTIGRVNRAALELSGRAEEEILGVRVPEVGAGEPWTTAAQLVSSIEPWDSVATAETRDARGRTWELSIAHFATAREGADRFIVVFWEITGIVDLQESLRRSANLSAMGALVAGVAHEVRNPLFGISATLDAYDAELREPAFEGFAPTLRREVRRLTDLMQELLEYGKPSVLALAHGTVDAVIGAAIVARLSSARAAGIALENLVTGSEATLLIDRSRLQQVFENLIDNAVQHSHPGGRVRIRSNPVEQGGRRWVELLVEDDGSGFPARDLDRVFEPFFTARRGGTGLGLSIVQRIVEEHSGKVTAGNRPEGGAVVAILLPLADATAKVVA
jgi:PAS domain S-box-containing protein